MISKILKYLFGKACGFCTLLIRAKTLLILCGLFGGIFSLLTLVTYKMAFALVLLVTVIMPDGIESLTFIKSSLIFEEVKKRLSSNELKFAELMEDYSGVTLLLSEIVSIAIYFVFAKIFLAFF